MKKLNSRYLKPRQIALLVFLVAPGLNVSHAEEFTGDTKLACEALLCLAATQSPGECATALARYFSFKGKNALKNRLNFLNLCPTATESQEMEDLTSALVNGAGGQCDVKSLNRMRSWQSTPRGEMQVVITDKMPTYCTTYYGNEIIASSVDTDMPVYVGTPEMSGYWVAQKDYATALADYNRQLEAWKAEQEAAAKAANNGS